MAVQILDSFCSSSWEAGDPIGDSGCTSLASVRPMLSIAPLDMPSGWSNYQPEAQYGEGLPHNFNYLYKASFFKCQASSHYANFLKCPGVPSYFTVSRLKSISRIQNMLEDNHAFELLL